MKSSISFAKLSLLTGLSACSIISTSLAQNLAPEASLPAKKMDKRPVPAAVVDDTPLDPEMLEKSIRQGVDFLTKTQNNDGSWGNATKTKGLNLYAPIPGAHHGFRTGSSCLALTGLLDSGDQRKSTLDAIAKGEAWLIKNLPRLRRADASTTYNVWGHSYALHSLAALARRDGVTKEQKQKYKEIAQKQVNALLKIQDYDGGWGYLHFDFITARPNSGSMSFTTATVMAGVHDAMQELGVTMPEVRVRQAKKSIIYQKNPDFSYVYARDHTARPRYPINRPAGSLARSQACNYALRVLGYEKVTDKVLVKWLDRLVKRNGWLDIGRKRPRPHETHFAVSGYFYFYGHYYAALGLELLPEETQKAWKPKLGKIIIQNQDKDGSWWDYPLYNYHQAYGTGYALSTLSRCR